MRPAPEGEYLGILQVLAINCMHTMRVYTSKFLVIGVMIASMFFAVSSARAQTQTDLLDSIASLMALVNSLQAQINAAGGVSVDTRMTSNTAAAHTDTVCPQIARDIKRGGQDSTADTSVSELQRFLVGTGDFNTTIVGTFGPATETAVKKFQCRELGICSGSPSTNGYGVVGKQTRAKIATRCTVATDATATVRINSISPSSFNDTRPFVPGATCKAWFDGCNTCSRETSGGAAACTAKACAVYMQGYCTGTFSNTGKDVCTQDVKKCPDGSWVGRTPPSCAFMCPTATSTSDTSGAASPGSIDGGNGGQQVPPQTGVCTQDYAPVCAIPPGCANAGGTGVATMLCMQQEPKTYTNTCAAKAARANVVYTGSCVSKPAIGDISGPTKLSAGQSGTWSFTASGAGTLEQSIEIWGSQTSGAAVSTGILTSKLGSSITHTFTTKGTYQIHFTTKVKTGSTVPGGQPMATKSITVTVE